MHKCCHKRSFRAHTHTSTQLKTHMTTTTTIIQRRGRRGMRRRPRVAWRVELHLSLLLLLLVFGSESGSAFRKANVASPRPGANGGGFSSVVKTRTDARNAYNKALSSVGYPQIPQQQQWKRTQQKFNPHNNFNYEVDYPEVCWSIGASLRVTSLTVMSYSIFARTIDVTCS